MNNYKDLFNLFFTSQPRWYVSNLNHSDDFFGGFETMYKNTNGETDYGFEDHKPHGKYETKDGYYMFYNVPGFNKENLSIEFENDKLVVQGERKFKIDNDEKITKIKFNINVGNVDPSKIECTIQDGIMTIFSPYKQQENKKKIKIN